jgi:flagellar basal-body rod modification protein FlgD
MVDSISSNNAATTTSGLSQALGNDKALGRDAFLKLLVAQLKNQDPLKPQDNAEFVAELAQFSNLEQTMGINDRLDLLSIQNSGLQNTEIVSLVGKQATVRGSLVTSNGTGVGIPVAFSLDGETTKTVVTVRDQNGRVVRTLDLGERDPGLVRVTWDGRDDAGNIQPAGTYAVAVQATNANDAAVRVSQETSGTVKAVSFDKGYPVIHLETGVSVPVSDLLRVDSPPNTSNP